MSTIGERIREVEPPVFILETAVKQHARQDALQIAAKRTLDIVGSSLALVMFSPVLLVLAILIVLDDGWPVVFRQKRLGKDGVGFTVYKFRSMRRDAEQRLADIARHNEIKDGPIFKWRHDPRITRVGRWLRRTSLDEILQLVNVFRGDMSLVGPRPPLEAEVRQYEDWQLRRLSVKPGMTGLWQVSGRSTLGFVHMVELDLEYIDTWSIWVDVVLLLRTPLAVLFARGAY